MLCTVGVIGVAEVVALGVEVVEVGVLDLAAEIGVSGTATFVAGAHALSNAVKQSSENR